MHPRRAVIAFLTAAFCSTLLYGDNLADTFRKAAERSTLDQPGTKPFHLKASVAPSHERDKDSGRTADIEIWWASPTQWKRELRTPGFHQVQIVNGNTTWQKNEGEYFPQWLQQTAVELVKPVPPLDDILKQAKNAQARHMGPMTILNLETVSGTSQTPNILRTYLALSNSTGLLLYGGGQGWGAEFKNYQDFHGLMVARTVNVGDPQVTATVTTLDDLASVQPDFFDPSALGPSSPPTQTIILNEVALRKNLLTADPTSWPTVQDGPFEGKISCDIVVDREGKIREMSTIVTENPALRDAGKQAVAAMRFKPFVVDGAPAQVMSQVTIPFKTSRPAGSEAFGSARSYFERGLHAGFPAFGNGAPYTLHAEFQVKSTDGTNVAGNYEDIWVSDTQWRRNASLVNGVYARSRNGDKTYQLAEGENTPMLQFVMREMEPIPALDTFTESDWKIRRDTVNGVSTIRLLAGYEDPQGNFDRETAIAYWFDDKGLLLKTYRHGIETERSDFQDFAGVKVARHIDVLQNGNIGLQIKVTGISPAGKISNGTFEIKGHEYTRQFTSEAR
ncbi:MAG TPA: hypothetical protein VF753_09680 [Terriglobales bacterium]